MNEVLPWPEQSPEEPRSRGSDLPRIVDPACGSACSLLKLFADFLRAGDCGTMDAFPTASS